MTSRIFRLYCFAVLSVWAVSPSRAAPPQGMPPAPVTVATASEQVLAPVARVTGDVISRDDSRLGSETAGRLEWVAQVGSRVKKGEQVARIDATLLKQQLAEHQATVRREQARLEFLAAEVGRLESLALQSNASKSRLEQAVSERSVARSDIDIARAKASQVEELIARSVLRSPFDGVVTERLMQAGEWADGGKSIVRVVDGQALEIRARVGGNALEYLREGMTLSVMAGDEEHDARIQTIVRVGDDQSRLYELRLVMDRIPWPAGSPVKVAVPTARSQNVIAVPRDALVLRRDGNAVFRINAENAAERVPVTMGIASGALIQVIGGIKPGDRVVTNGGERLRPGQTVRVIDGGAHP